MNHFSGSIRINGQTVTLSNPDKLLWKEKNITKLMYVEKLMFLSKYMIPYAKDRLLTYICYPDGVEGKSFYRKNIPDHAPTFLSTAVWNDTEYILLNHPEDLAWLGNMAALEFHVSFDKGGNQNPDCLVFDLDPSSGQTFDDVTKAALIIHDTLESLNIQSNVKTSGATGLQIYIYTACKYDYEKARAVNEFFARYFCEKYPDIFTMERTVKKRGKKLYFDYLQMWQGKTIICPYSPRAVKDATVATPVTWEELRKGVKPEDFTLENIKERLGRIGDLFSDLQDPKKAVDLDFIAEKTLRNYEKI